MKKKKPTSSRRKRFAGKPHRADKAARNLDRLLKKHKLSELVFDEELNEYRPNDAGGVKVKHVKGRKSGRTNGVHTYQVFRDVHGIAYLRVSHTDRGAQFVVNKAFSVELIDIDANSTHGHHLALRAVPNASIYECAKRLLHPLNDQCTISQRAKEALTKILNSKELKMKATATNVSPTRPQKFATVTAPPAKKGKAPVTAAAKAPAKGKAPAKKAASNGSARTTIAGKKIKVLNRKHEAREGTKRAKGLDIILASKTTDEAIPKLTKIGADSSFIKFAVDNGFISLS